MKTTCAWLAEDAGITLGVTSLTSYISRIRRREARQCGPPAAGLTSADVHPAVVHARAAALQAPPVSNAVSVDFDPLANFRASQAKNPGFHYRLPTAEDEKDLI